MDEQEYLDFLSALGEEFCEALCHATGQGGIVPQDGYEVCYRVFEREPDPQMLASLTDSDLEKLRAGCEEYLGRQGVTLDQIRSFVSGTLARWPAGAA